MALSADLVSQFAKMVNSDNNQQTESTVYGTIVESDGKKYVRLDGSNLDTPISTTTDAKHGDRVTVLIKDHSAIVTGNMSSPSINTETELDNGDGTSTKISEFGIVVAKKVDVDVLNAEIARVGDLIVNGDAEIRGKLEASEAEIEKLVANDATIEGTLDAHKAVIDNLDATYAKIDVLESDYAKIKDLEATNVIVRDLEADYGEFKKTTVDNLSAAEADIDNLEADNVIINETLDAQKAVIDNLDTKFATIDNLDSTNAKIENLEAEDATINGKLDAQQAVINDLDVNYANIDFSNIKMAAVEELFTKSGIIKDLVVGEQSITGELIGVTIKGDLIEAGTVKADKLVVKGSDGIFYKLNVEAGGLSAEEAPTESLHGSVITARSITADRVAVTDLVAFRATIGGFKLTENSIYSGVKESVHNTTTGIYQDNEGQFALGNGDQFLKFYKQSDGTYRLDISADSISIGSSKKSVETIIDDAQKAIDAVNDLEERANNGEFAGEDATVLRIDSSRGTVFKNSAVSTVLSAVIYRGSKRITDIDTLRQEYGNGAYLEWLWQRIGETTFGTIISTDPRIGNDGFTFTLSPEDVDTKVVFMCQLITD